MIIALAYLIQSLVVDRLYILGDIYDRGPAAEKVMDRLMAYHYVSIQWGNHDVSWMGAASGCDALVANVIRLALRYATLETLLNGYGINLRRLEQFAEATYGDDPCTLFRPLSGRPVEDYPPEVVARMHKAIAIIQFKLDAQVIQRHPEYAMDDRLVLDTIDMRTGTTTLYGATYPLRDANWPTLDPSNTAALTDDEAAVIADLAPSVPAQRATAGAYALPLQLRQHVPGPRWQPEVSWLPPGRRAGRVYCRPARWCDGGRARAPAELRAATRVLHSSVPIRSPSRRGRTRCGICGVGRSPRSLGASA